MLRQLELLHDREAQRVTIEGERVFQVVDRDADAAEPLDHRRPHTPPDGAVRRRAVAIVWGSLRRVRCWRGPEAARTPAYGTPHDRFGPQVDALSPAAYSSQANPLTIDVERRARDVRHL